MSRLRTVLRLAVLAAFALALASVPFLHLQLGARHTHGDDTVAHVSGHPH